MEFRRRPFDVRCSPHSLRSVREAKQRKLQQSRFFFFDVSSCASKLHRSDMHVQLVSFFFLSSKIRHYMTVIFLIDRCSESHGINWSTTVPWPELLFLVVPPLKPLFVFVSSRELRRRFHQLSSDDGSITWALTTVPSPELQRWQFILTASTCYVLQTKK